ncbi:hypothetical protein [Streptomyces sp. NPDC048606]|uniref:hypothetical protein n=1 Tax=Streptomyces sp. NPDC048606 TaxID=3154726 RepID=UPI0034397423
MEILGAVEQRVAEAETQLVQGLWEPTAADAALAQQTALSLRKAVESEAVRRLERIARLEGLRQALAALALGVARTHGQLAWFLAQCCGDLSPVLHWRALDAPRGHAFGTRRPSSAELADAEGAVRLLAATLTHIADRPTDSSIGGL